MAASQFLAGVTRDVDGMFGSAVEFGIPGGGCRSTAMMMKLEIILIYLSPRTRTYLYDTG